MRIDGTRIDNRGLEHLENLALLEHVDVRWTRVAANSPQQLAIPIETLAGSFNNLIVVRPDFWDKMEGELAWRDGVTAIPDAAQGDRTERWTESAKRWA